MSNCKHFGSTVSEDTMSGSNTPSPPINIQQQPVQEEADSISSQMVVSLSKSVSSIFKTTLDPHKEEVVSPRVSSGETSTLASGSTPREQPTDSLKEKLESKQPIGFLASPEEEKPPRIEQPVASLASHEGSGLQKESAISPTSPQQGSEPIQQTTASLPSPKDDDEPRSKHPTKSPISSKQDTSRAGLPDQPTASPAEKMLVPTKGKKDLLILKTFILQWKF